MYIRTVIFVFLCFFSNALFAGVVSKELSWSSVPLEGMHLRLESPKEKDQSSDLYFSKGGSLAITSCNKGVCVAPLTVWKIANNRLVTGYDGSGQDTLLEYTGKKLVMRSNDGQTSTYLIVK